MPRARPSRAPPPDPARADRLAAPAVTLVLETLAREEARAVVVLALAAIDAAQAVVRGEADAPDARVSGSTAALAEVVHGGRKLSDALKTGDLVLEGDKAWVRRFLTFFPAPEPAASSVAA